MEREETTDALLDEALTKAWAGGAPASFRAAIERAAKESSSPAALPLPAPGQTGSAQRTWLLALLAATMAAILALVAALVVMQVGGRTSPTAEPSLMLREAVNDHLRVLYSEHPVEIASGGIHQVKPWFAGKLEFAPTNPFAGDDEFPLEGGAISYFLDRKAATYVYKRNLHVVTLFVFQSAGLTFPEATTQVGPRRATAQTSKGFHVLLWRTDDLGYALVSDLNEQELTKLAAKIAY